MPTEERILDQVRHCLDKANHPNTPEAEREMCLKRADTLMSRHAIDQAMLDLTRNASDRRKPTSREFQAWEGWQWRGQFETILTQIAKTAGVRCVIGLQGKTTLVGYTEDVEYVEMLWTTIYFQFIARIDPKWDNSLSFEHNVYNFKESGTKWPEIRDIARANNNWVDWPDGGRLKRAYQRHCRIIGEEPRNHTQRHQAYKQSYADGFETRICARLEAMRRSREEDVAGTTGASLVLVGAKEQVDEMFFLLFPERHPAAIRERNAKAMEEYRKTQEEEKREREEMLAAMTPRAREEFLAKEARKRQREAKANERYWAERENSTYDSSGSRAGARAAEQVDLGRVGGSVGNSTKGEIQ